MKRLIITLVIISFALTGCKLTDSGKNNNLFSLESNTKTDSGVWLSFSEINNMLESDKGFKAELYEVAENCEKLKINNIYIHVRAYCDSLFSSKYFPEISLLNSYDYDVFKEMIDVFHAKNIKVHAWINPYRVLTSSSDINSLNVESPAYKWLNDSEAENDINVCIYNGIYLNPAEYEVRELVINGIREIISLYEVDGIHFDDYFYPTTDPEFDKISYEKYKQGTKKPLSLEDWRRANVNSLISGCYTAIKFMNKDLVFSISPAASIEKNYNELYADVEMWVENGCADIIIPQIYFGFEYPSYEYQFEKLVKDWKKLMKVNKNVELHIGLATYKIGTEVEPDKKEWQKKTDIIARQVEICKEDAEISGYIYFSYSSLFDDAELNSKQRDNLLKLTYS